LKKVIPNISSCFIFHSKTDIWGESILIMEKFGKAFGRIYWFNDDNTTIYLDWLSVDENVRRKGIGTELQEMREGIGLQLGATIVCLWVRKNTWMYDWYHRRGYQDWKDHKTEENAIWMKKKLR
jgi:GNAT superfamily N-acetyltransferase